MILDSTDLRPLLLSRLHIHHWRIRNDLTVWYAQNYTPLKIPTHPTHQDYYSIVIKINIWAFQSLDYLRPVSFEEV